LAKKDKQNLPVKPETASEFILYQADDGQTKIQVRLVDGTVWLPQRSIAELFQKDVRTVNEHVRNIFSDEELRPEATVRKFRIVQPEGTRRVERLVGTPECYTRRTAKKVEAPPSFPEGSLISEGSLEVSTCSKKSQDQDDLCVSRGRLPVP